MNRIINMLFIFSIIASFLVGCSLNNGNKEQVNETEKQQNVSVKGKESTTEKNSDIDKKNQEDKTETDVTGKSVDNQGKAVSAKGHNEIPTKIENEQGTKTKVQGENTKQLSIVANQTSEKPASMSTSTAVAKPPTTTQKAEQEKENNEQINKVVIAIKADKKTGIILRATEVNYEQGDTVLDILKKATKENKIQMEYSGSGGTAYIEGIQNLYEFDKGPKSGWMYSVNGTFMKKGAGSFAVNPGDKIEWLYTLDLGKDLEANVNE